MSNRAATYFDLAFTVRATKPMSYAVTLGT